MIEVIDREYRDHLGRTISGDAPMGNQGDIGTYIISYNLFCGFIVNSEHTIQVTGNGGALIFTVSGFENGWSDVGIEAGDVIDFLVKNVDTNASQTQISGPSTTVSMINGNDLIISNIPIITNFTSMDGHFYVDKKPEAVKTLFNLIPSTIPSGENSYIDQSQIILQALNINSLAVNGSTTLNQIGNKSGGEILASTIEREADIQINIGTVAAPVFKPSYVYKVAVKFRWWMVLSDFEQDYFLGNLTMTPFIHSHFFPTYNNFGVQLQKPFKLPTDGNSGFRDENFNQNPNTKQISSFKWMDVNSNPISAFDFSNPTKFEIKISTDSLLDFGTNFGLIFFNDVHDLDSISFGVNNNNGDYSHSQHIILAEKSNLTATTGQSFTSYVGNNGEQLSFSNIAISINTVLSIKVATITGDITPNAQFISKFSDPLQNELDFVFLARCEKASFSPSNYSDTVNLLVWKGKGEVQPPILGEYPLESSEIYDHYRYQIGNKDENKILITEDDFRIVIDFKFLKNRLIKSFKFGLIAKNTISGEFFYLQENIFNIPQTFDVNGKQEIDQSFLDMNWKNYFTNNPSNSTLTGLVKAYNNQAKIVFNVAFDNPSEYGLNVFFPFLMDWRYWLSQPSAFNDFGNSANKNFIDYQIGDWEIQGIFETQVAEGWYQNFFNLPTVLDYDSNSNVTPTFTFFKLDNTPITAPLNNEPCRVVCTWETVISGLSLNVLFFWGQITVEPYEGGARWSISDPYNENNNLQNSPLIPLTGEQDLKTTVTYNPYTVIHECIFDPSKIDTSTGISFTGRLNAYVSNTSTILSERTKKSFPVAQIPDFPTDQGKKSKCCDCEPELKLASSNSDELIKNDITGISHKNQVDSDTCEFKMYKDGVLLPNYGVDLQTGLPNDTLASAFVYNWRQYLLNYGEGCYSIEKDITVAGNSITVEVGKYVLKEFTTENAEGTTRVLYQCDFVTEWDEYNVLSKINYSGSGFEDSYRFRGMFGRWQPNVSSFSDMSVSREFRQTKVDSDDTFILRAFKFKQCDVDRLHYVTMHATVWRMSDHNFTNPQQKLIITDCILEENNKEEITYNSGSRIMGVEIILKKRHQNSVSLFNGSVAIVKGVVSQFEVIPGITPPPPPNVEVNVNGELYGNFQNPNTIDVSVETECGNTDFVEVASGSVTVPSELPCWIPPMPSPLGVGVYWLIEHIDGGENTWSYNGTGGNLTIDGGSPTSIPNNTQTAIDIPEASTTGFVFGGRKFSWLFFEPMTTPISAQLGYGDVITNPNYTKYLNTILKVVNCDVGSYFVNLYSGNSNNYYIRENVPFWWFSPTISVDDGFGIFAFKNIQKIINFPELQNNCYALFYKSIFDNLSCVFDVNNVIQLNSAFGWNSDRGPQISNIKLKFINSEGVQNIQGICRANESILSIEFNDLGDVTNANNLISGLDPITLTSVKMRVQRIILNALAVSFDISYCVEMNATRLVEMINSLADLTPFPTQNIKMTGVPDYNDPAVVSAASAKNWTIII